MSIRLVKGDGIPYAQIANEILRHPELSLKAKGLYSYMYSMPNNWNFTASSMAAQLKEARKAILSIMKELKDFGLLSYEKQNSGKGIYTIYSSVVTPKSQKGTKPNLHQSPKTTPCQNDTVPKRDCIKNKDSIKNKDFINNPKNGVKDYKSSLKSKSKKQKLNLTKEEQEYKQKLISCNYIGFITKVMVENKFECVYIDDHRKIYTDSRSNKQILSSTLTEIYKQLHQFNESKKKSNSQRLENSLSKLKD